MPEDECCANVETGQPGCWTAHSLLHELAVNAKKDPLTLGNQLASAKMILEHCRKPIVLEDAIAQVENYLETIKQL